VKSSNPGDPDALHTETGRDVLLALNRSATAARLLAGVVHDVNNALQVISGTAELLSGRPDLPESMAPALDRLRRQTARAAHVLADVQLFTRGSISEQGRVHLREVVEHSLALRQFTIKRAGLTGRLEVSGPDAHFVHGNRTQLQQAILNLVVNAEQALAGRSGDILVELAADGASIILRVSDQGPGMTVQPPEQAFRAFVTTRDPWEGAGLGLWAARTIVAEHGGTIALESSTQGTTVTIRLPRAS
jgi:two-component system NtrC family sensor kinase